MPLRRKPLITSLMIFIIHVAIGHSFSCPSDEYRVEQRCCSMCPAGHRVNKHCTEFASTLCEPCTDGTFLDQFNGQTRCFLCTKCDAASGLKVKRRCTTTSDAVCEPADGYHCIDLTEDDCVAAQKHRSCKPGQYISRTGTAATDTVCSDCTGATYSDGTFASCQPHTICESIGLQQIRPGNYSADSECGEKQDSSNTTGIVVGVVLPLIVIAVIAVTWMCLKKKREKQITGVRGAKRPSQSGDETSEVCSTLKQHA